MADHPPGTPEELAARRQAAWDNLRQSNVMKINPTFGNDLSNPENNLERVFAQPELSQTLPTGKAYDPADMSAAAAQRRGDIQDFLKNPQQYAVKNASVDLPSQSLIDKGKTMLSQIFDYTDDKDLEIFGMNLSAVESVWDGVIAHVNGSYNLLNAGMTALASAAPGGVQTFSWDDVSGGQSVGDVFGGSMANHGVVDAPSFWQTAITSAALEAKKLREGKGDLASILNPAAAIGLLAPDSPLQKDGFNILDKQQRDEAFASGWEHWMSGLADAAMTFADPLLGAGVAFKAIKLGALGQRLGGAASRAALEATSLAAAEHVNSYMGIADDVVTQISKATGEADALPASIRDLGALTEEEVTALSQKPRLTSDVLQTSRKDSKNPLVRVYEAVLETDAEGNKKLSPDNIRNMFKEVDGSSIPSEVATMMHKAETPMELHLLMSAMHGSPTATKALSRIAPVLADQVFQAQTAKVLGMAGYQGEKMAEATGYLTKIIENSDAQIKLIEDQMRASGFTVKDGALSAADGMSAEMQSKGDYLFRSLRTHQQNISQANELMDVLKNGKPLNQLNPASAFFDEKFADDYIKNLMTKQDYFSRMLRTELQSAMTEARVQWITKDNWYAKMTADARIRAGKARYQYAEEGTSILPRQKLKASQIIEDEAGNRTAADGGALYESTGWFAKSRFEADGVGRLRRNIRIWRWLGTETPSGWIGLKGSSTVGSEREFHAAMDTDLYRGDPIKVTTKKKIVHEDGSVTIEEGTKDVGGTARRDALYRRLYDVLNNPEQGDAFKVLSDIEHEIAGDYADVFGIDRASMEKFIDEADRVRAANMDTFRRKGYFADPEGDIDVAPFLDSHLASGAYMHNWHELERLLHLHAKDGGERLRMLFDAPISAAESVYNTFNTFWRPLTLMRASYTQRNLFEGLIRAMAYQASLAPLTWPVKGTYYGVMNKIAKRGIEKKVAAATEVIEKSKFHPYVVKHEQAVGRLARLKAALKDDTHGTYNIYSFDKDGKIVWETVDEKQFDSLVDQAVSEVDTTKAAMQANIDQFHQSIKDTEFGGWLDTQLKDLEGARAQQVAALRNHNELLEEVKNRLSEQYGDSLDQLLKHDDFRQAMQQVVADGEYLRQLDVMYARLERDPAYSLAQYRQAAGRQRRIGSGSSIGPDGNRYADAWNGPLEAINRSLMSADVTVKQMLSARGDTWGNLWRKMIVHPHDAINYSVDPEAWINGMKQTIEDFSSSRLVRKLVETDFNVGETTAWIMSSDPEAKRMLQHISELFAHDDGVPLRLSEVADKGEGGLVNKDAGIFIKVKDRTNPNAKESFDVKPFAESDRGFGGSKLTMFDRDAAGRFVAEVNSAVQYAMQGHDGFMKLLRQRIVEKEAGAKSLNMEAKFSVDDVRAVVNSLSDEDKAMLGFIKGDREIVLNTTENAMEFWKKFTGMMFKYLGTIPEDAITRGPFYASRFKQTRNALIEQYWERQGKDINAVRRAVKSADGTEMADSLAHDSFTIPINDLNKIIEASHRRALMDTKEWMYTIDRRTKLGKYGEWMFPFISATQNSAVVAGKLLWKEPWLAPFIADLWKTSQHGRFEDDQGNILLPLPGAVASWLEDHPEIPVFGGVVQDGDTIKVPKNGLNVFMPETGFGLAPTPGPIQQVVASELMKANIFPAEPPEIWKHMFGNDDNAKRAYDTLKDYIFGQNQTMSSTFLSIDKLAPAWMQRAWNSGSVPFSNELTSEYGYQFTNMYQTEMARYRAGLRDTPLDMDEIGKRTTNYFWFAMIGNLGIPTPLTPYPILTRPEVEKSPIKVLQDTLRAYQEADPLTASANFQRDFGSWATDLATTKITGNVGGADPTAESVSDIDTLQHLIAQVAPTVGDHLDLLGILVNNRSPLSGYDASAYQWEKAATIPGTAEQWRKVQSPEQSVAERQKAAGWTVYRQFMDQMNARLQAAGLPNYSVAAAAPFKVARDQFIQNMIDNSEFRGWTVDFQDRGGDKATAAVRVIEAAVNDETFQNLMVSSGNGNTLSAMMTYVQTRAELMKILENSPAGITAQSMAPVLEAWQTIRQNLLNSDVRWGDIQTLYLSADENPMALGSFQMTGDGNG